ncbi:Gfo/Idh/MocA family protein [Umezawaea endophytica]|uniref:Gfo/Idh/MocA family oxidoreductase n=1 Tax=Umezawaea endophytica TaxID=1654476 RepID=A0A9X2VFB8_9PSEU|nr:Gfo/Idh/MocA family oxidoreductase [Umezawaea endophytica]MCS7475630.1 Gfo/Idh/MocA family oxidoreductase [Umezawaea endophytica]
MTGIALVGCGAMGEIVARSVYSGPGAPALVAVVDPDPDRAGRVAAVTGAAPFATLAEALGATGATAVDVRVPHHLHAEVVLEALEAGCHVLVEKPVATTLAEARWMVEAAADGGLVLAVAENYPHLRAVVDARAALEAGEVGAVLAILATRAYRVDGVWVRDGWRRGTGPSSGVLLDQGTHQASLVRQLGGAVEAVSASGRTPDAVALTLRLADGGVAQTLLTWSSPGPAAQVEAAVVGTGGRLDVVVDYDGDEGGCRLWTPDGSGNRGAENYYDSHRVIVDDWLRAIDVGGEAVVPGREGLADLAVVLAAVDSLERDGAFVAVAAG